MAEHRNCQLIRDGYAAFSKGDLAALGELFTNDVQWHEAGGGRTPVAGDFKGQEAVFGMFGQLMQLTDGNFHVSLIDVIADDHQAVAIHEATARRGMHTYASREAIVFHLLEGKVTDAWHTVPDAEAYDEFWSDDLDVGADDDVARIRRGYDAFLTGDMATVLDLIAPDAVWHFRAGSRLDGDYVGRDNVLAMLAESMQMADVPPTMEIHDVLANGEHGTVLLTQVSTIDGVEYRSEQVHVYHLRDGQATECWVAATDVPQTVAIVAAEEKKPTVELVRAGYEAFSTGDMAALTEIIADDVVWTTIGNSPMAGTWRSRDEVFGMFGRLVQETGGSMRIDVEDVCISGERSSTLVNVTATRNGRTVTDNAVHVARYADGKLVEFTSYPGNPAVEDEFWS
jgi:ketosteroid isomerase-like protein